MNLRSGCVLWPHIDRDPPIAAPPLSHDLRCDVAIIGAGISGALAAYHFAQQGVHVAMFDARDAAGASTAASTGLLQYEIDTPLVKLVQKIGRDQAIAVYRASLRAVLDFEPLLDPLGDRCGLTARTSLYLASSDQYIDTLRAECEARRSIGIEVDFLSKDALRDEFGISRPAALRSAKAFDVDPYRLTRQLIRRSIQHGVELFCETRIARFEAGADGGILHCAGGPRIEARKVIFAMGYETLGLIQTDLCRVASTYALATEPVLNLAGWRDRCLIWETARPYLYMRTTPDDRVIVGGEDEPITDSKERDALIEVKAKVLVRRFSEIFPDIATQASFAWAGAFAETSDGLPYIGTLRAFPNCYFALGYGGNGITFSLLAAQIIRDDFLGRPNELAGIFDFARPKKN